MRKYGEVFRLSFKMQIAWRFDVMMTMAAAFAHIVTMWILWQAIFEGRELIEGFTFEAMLSYHVVCAILRSVDFSNQISGEVSELIRGGRFSRHMVAPVNPMGFFGCLVAGETAFHIGFSVMAAAACAFLFKLPVSLTADMPRILLAAATIPLGLSFMACYRYFLGVLTFKFLEISFILYMQMSLAAFATGAFVPLALLPKAVLGFLRYMPFTHVVYTPAMLLTGQMDAAEGLSGLAVLLAWTVIMAAAAQGTYRRLRLRYDGVGI